MKKVIFIIILLSIAGISGYVVINILNKNKQIQNSEMIRQSIGWFRNYLDSRNITFNENQPVCLIFFNPDCEYCQNEAKSIYENKYKLGDIQWFWISGAGMDIIEEFKSHFQLSEIPKLQVIHDSSGFLTEEAGISTIPQFLIYDYSGELIKEFKGETKIEAILDVDM